MASAVYTSAATSYASAVITKHYKDLLKIASGRLGLPRFGDTNYERKGEDGTVRWNRILRLGKITAARTNEYDMFGHASAQSLETNYIESSPVTYENSIGFTDKVDIVSWIKNADNRATIANQIARTTEYYTMKELVTHCLRYRVDGSTTYAKTFTAGNTSTTSAVVSATLNQADSFWVGGYLCFTAPEGPTYDQAGIVSASDQSDTNATMTTAFTVAPTTSSKGQVTVGTGLAATNILTTAALIKVSAMHELLETEKFDGGVYRAMIHAQQHADLWADTTFLNSAIYDDSGRFASLRIGRWFDIEFMVNSEMYREDVNGTANQSTGIVYVSPIFGKHAFSCIHWGSGDPVFGIDIFPVDNPDSNNLTGSRRWISWKGMFNVKETRATSCIGLMTGATDLAVTI